MGEKYRIIYYKKITFCYCTIVIIEHPNFKIQKYAYINYNIINRIILTQTKILVTLINTSYALNIRMYIYDYCIAITCIYSVGYYLYKF